LAATSAALKFFDWAYKNGGKMAADLDYVPLPESLINQVRATWKSQIKGVTLAGTPGAKQM
jgi:phosphate transport system substrate-binding protein